MFCRPINAGTLPTPPRTLRIEAYLFNFKLYVLFYSYTYFSVLNIRTISWVGDLIAF